MEDVFVYFDHLPKEIIDPNRLFATASKYSLNLNLSRNLQMLDNPEDPTEEMV